MQFELHRDEWGYPSVHIAGHEVWSGWWLSEARDEKVWEAFFDRLHAVLEEDS